MGQGGKGISQAGVCIAIEVPLAPEASPSGEDGEGDDLAGTERRLGSGVLLCLRAGLAEVVHHDVKCGEEGVHIDHERRFLICKGTTRQTRMGIRTDTSWHVSGGARSLANALRMTKKVGDISRPPSAESTPSLISVLGLRSYGRAGDMMIDGVISP